jgi:hypothetical protein
MRDWQAGRLRYLMHFSDGGSGMRHFDARLDEGGELREGVQQYVVERVSSRRTRTRSGTRGRGSWPTRALHHVRTRRRRSDPIPFASRSPERT